MAYLYGWKSYRHGRQKRNRSQKRLLNHNKRQYIIGRLTDILDDFRLTKFEHEAACRHGLRSALCLEGHGWEKADAEAAYLVGEALNRIGAKRPTREEGQRYYADGKEYCANCRSSMDGAPGRFCSKECARAVLQQMTRWDQYLEDRVLMAAKRMITRGNKEKIECEQCGKAFHPLHDKIRFCSAACSKERLRTRFPKECLVCGEIFQPPRANQRCCSISCAGKLTAKLRAERIVGGPRFCIECGDEFVPKDKRAIYCGQKCNSKANYNRKMAKKRADKNPNIIRLPLPDPRPLTPELVDGLLAA